MQLLAEAAGTPYSELQLISFGVEILRNTHDFQDGIKSWNRLTTANRNWATFIKHFEQEYQELLELRGPSMQSSVLHSANSIVQKMKASVEQSVESSVTKALNRHNNNTIVQESAKITESIPIELQNLQPGYSI